jgi:hypothetical protein
VHLFNLVGYALFFQYFINRSDKQLVHQLDKNQYNEVELIELKVALNMPYFTGGSEEYERYDGEIEFNGAHYNYVKRKVQHDTLYLMCVPNTAKTELYAARNDYAKQANDIPNGGKNEGSSLKKNIEINEYDQQFLLYSLLAPAIPANKQTHHVASHLINPFIDKNDRPPQV